MEKNGHRGVLWLGHVKYYACVSGEIGWKTKQMVGRGKKAFQKGMGK
jgi:hypothetical protein